MSLIGLHDVDGMIYAAGSVAEDVYYVVAGTRFDYKSHATKYCEEYGLDKAGIEMEVDAQPVANALNILKTIVNAANEAAGCDVYEAYLSPQDRSNFRFDIYPEYKANRKDAHKPVHFAALRSYAVKHLDAVVVSGMEADDMLSIRAYELGLDKVCIISADKDMRNVPTTHYNWQKKTPVHQVSQYEGWQNYFTQLLTGDAVDNIKGCPGIGPAKARKALKECATDADMLEACRLQYVKAYDGDEDEAYKMCLLNARLLHLLEKRP